MVAKIYVNGDAQEVSLPLNVSELIQQQNVLVDFLYFMGGGQALDNLTISQLDNCRHEK